MRLVPIVICLFVTLIVAVTLWVGKSFFPCC